LIDTVIDLLRLRGFGFLDLFEILVLGFVFYRLLLLIRGTRAVQMVYGVIGLLFIYWITGPELLGLETIHRLIMPLLFYVPFAIIVVFQNTIRRALTGFGVNPFGRYLGGSQVEDKLALVISAAYALAARRIGGLIVLEREQGLRNWTESGITLDANISYDLIVNVFSPYTPLHDGALVIGDGRLRAASCFLPLTSNPALSTKYGTRHRAAIGITEETDAACVVISEERGTVSLAIDGVIHDALDKSQLRRRLEKAMEPARRRRNERVETPKGAARPRKLQGGVYPAEPREGAERMAAPTSGTAGTGGEGGS
jgi:uncharacterized protein (TIGR00159 family)